MNNHILAMIEHDIQAVNSIFKLYGKLFKTYFVSYSSGTKIIDKFTEAREQTITRSDLWAFLKDKQLDLQTNMDELGDLVRQINLEHFQIRGDPNNLSFTGYKIFMLEISGKFFPETVPMPPAFCLKKLLSYLQNVDVFDEKIKKIFENPQYAGIDDYDLIEHLNEQVNKNPRMKIPDSFSLQKRTQVEYEFKVTPAAKVGDSYRVCYEILNELISKEPKLGFDFIEPLPRIKEIYYVKPTIFFKNTISKKLTAAAESMTDLGPLNTSNLSLSNISNNLSAGEMAMLRLTAPKPAPKMPKEPHFLSEAEKKMMFAKPLVTLSTNLKLHVSKYDQKELVTAKDCAFVLEELLQKACDVVEGREPEPFNRYSKLPLTLSM